MEKKQLERLVPEQNTGVNMDAESVVELETETAARQFFEEVKSRLQNIDNWHVLAGVGSATFRLTDSNGQEVSRRLQKGDHLKIDIPGPGSKSGGGYDWVQIEAVESSSTPLADAFGFRVRPAKNPCNPGEDIAHFYAPNSTSTFTVTRINTTVAAVIYDRNIEVNDTSASLFDKLRNAATGTAGKLGFSVFQWKLLTDGLVKLQE